MPGKNRNVSDLIGLEATEEWNGVEGKTAFPVFARQLNRRAGAKKIPCLYPFA
ncbi:hypothetical protein GA8_03795 [Geobacillus sp. A8]|nr:hypothetical protein GA8_03795 [Geobacillus sp. A8]